MCTVIGVGAISAATMAMHSRSWWAATAAVALAWLWTTRRRMSILHARLQWLDRLSVVAVRTRNAVLLMDANGCITWVNSAFTHQSGYTLDDVRGWSPLRLLNGEVADPGSLAEVSHALSMGSGARVTLPFLTRTGTRYWSDFTIEPSRVNGGLDGFISVQTNVTEQVNATAALSEARKQAEAANRSKGEFLANMSHEIRTPLTAILGYADVLLMRHAQSERPADDLHALQTIARAGEHLMSVLDDVLDLSKIDADRLQLESVPVCLPQLLMDVESMMRPRALAKHITLTTALRSPVPETIRVDPTRLRQILVNLVGNAIKFTDSGGVAVEVAVEISDASRVLRISVEDTGAGIDPAGAEILFDPFMQADSTVTRRFGGTGLGLPISRRLAQRMGGTLGLVRSAPGMGSRFELVIPVEPVTSTPWIQSLSAIRDAPRRPVARTKVTGRILLAEDGDDNQQVIAELLRGAGAHVTIVGDGKAALTAIQQADLTHTPFDLLLTDIQMPGMDGHQLVRALRRAGHSIPIVALTACALVEERVRCLDAGCDGFASKPIRHEELLAVCQRWIGTRARVQADEVHVAVGSATPLRVDSVLANDPELGPLALKFGALLPNRVAAIQMALDDERVDDAGRLAHQLAGAAGSYGYRQVGKLAAQLEGELQTSTTGSRSTLAQLARLAAGARRSARGPSARMKSAVYREIEGKRKQ